MKLNELLQRDQNNIDIIRVYAALMVIFGHAHAFLPSNKPDMVFEYLGFDYSGSLAVKIFFFLSGLVVTNSLMHKKNAKQFIASRLFRIWPALIVVVSISVFILGPLLSSLSFLDYFSSSETWGYFNNILMKTRYTLPGVFSGGAHPVVNGSLWTIPYEVFAYILLLVLSMLFNFNKTALTVLSTLVILDPLTGNQLLFTWISADNLEVSLVGPCFAFGVLLALYKDSITINTKYSVLLFVLYLLFRNSSYNFYFFYIFLFITILKLSSTSLFLKIKPKADVSYGIYLWGWPVQKILIFIFPMMTISYHQIFASIIAILLGTASWYLIEEKFIKIGRSFK